MATEERKRQKLEELARDISKSTGMNSEKAREMAADVARKHDRKEKK